MAGLEPLIPYIYHEKQQEGSMLCAQHALNSLLQAQYFTAPDLSEHARSLDALEESYDDSNTGSSSTNMDDTGFFSIQVLDTALKVLGLNLTRWRSEVMKPYHDRPHTQLGFILNLEQHWYALRRFGKANADIDQDDGTGHWFNLNSFLSTPEWVGKTYLGMVLQQAEAEGYSVFAVTQAAPDQPLALPRTDADMIAATLPEPSSASMPRPLFTGNSQSVATGDGPAASSGDFDFEEEDYELQAALQASLTGQGTVEDAEFQSSSSPQLPVISSTFSSIDSHNSPRTSSTGSESGAHTPQIVQARDANMSLRGHADVDPVTASTERNRVLLQRMREQQEFAQREMWSESDLTPEEQHALEERRQVRRRQEEEEESELQRAIQESEALAQQHQLRRESNPNVDMADNDYSSMPSQHFPSSAMFDDEDAELQAALKASLEYSAVASVKPSDTDDLESIASESTDIAPDPVMEAPSLDEIRTRRLARFGL